MREPPSPPNDRPLSDAELAVYVAKAILDDRQNPGHDLPFQPSREGLLARLGLQAHLHRPFLEANRELDFRLAEYCWRMVGLGFFVPQIGGTWGVFHPTARGRAFLEGMDPTALIPGGIDSKLKEMGFAEGDLARQYSRLSQDCFLAGHYETAVVMLGAASESLVHRLAEALSTAQPHLFPNANPRPTSRAARHDLVWTSDTLSAQRGNIRRELDSVHADTSWLDNLGDLLTGTAQSIRITRNEFGHPTGVQADQLEALQLLQLFPRFADTAARALDALSHI